MLRDYFIEFTGANLSRHRIWVGHTERDAALAVESLGVDVKSPVENPDGTVSEKYECCLPAYEWLFNYRCNNPKTEEDCDCGCSGD